MHRDSPPLPTPPQYFKSSELATLLETSLATAKIVPSSDAAHVKGVTFANATTEGGSRDGHAIHWLHIEDQAASVREDVAKIVGHSLVAAGIPVHGAQRGRRGGRCVTQCVPHRPAPPTPPGYIYDVKTGGLQHVVSQVTA